MVTLSKNECAMSKGRDQFRFSTKKPNHTKQNEHVSNESVFFDDEKNNENLVHFFECVARIFGRNSRAFLTQLCAALHTILSKMHWPL